MRSIVSFMEGEGLKGTSFRQDSWTTVLRLRGYLFAVFGAGILIASYWAEGQQSLQNQPWYASSLAVGVGRTTGVALMIFGILNVLVEFQSTIRYVQNRLGDSLDEYTPVFKELAELAASRDVERVEILEAIKKTDPERLERLRLNLLGVVHDMDYKRAGEFSIVLKKEIEPLLGLPHYDKMVLHFHNEFINHDGRCYIRSQRTKTAVVHCMNNGRIPIGVRNVHRPIDGIAPEALYQIHDLRVAGESVILPDLTPVASNGFLVVDYPLELDVCADSPVEVFWNEEILLPANDVIRWSVGPRRSLKTLELVCDFDTAVFPQITAHGFDTTLSTHESEKSCTLSFTGWMLPFQGCVIAWTDPCSSCTT